MASERSSEKGPKESPGALRSRQPTPARQEALRRLISPRSIAVIGASADPSKWGSRVIRYLQKFGYDGMIHPVNPKYSTLAGLPCHASIAQLPHGVDLALVALPAELVTDTVRQLGAKGVKGVAIFSSGFAEVGHEGGLLQEDLSRVAADAGIRLLGPNCIGIINVRDRVAASASSALELSVLFHEPISVLSQSGAIGLASVLNRGHDHGVGFSRMVSTGNEADLEMADFIDYLVEDSATEVISFYAEGFRRGRRLLAAFERAFVAGKPIVGLMVGQTTESRQVAISHTGLMAEERYVIRGIFRQFGVIEAKDLDDLYEKAAVFARCRQGGGRKVGIVTTSGGIGALLADLCADAGLTFPSLEDATQTRLRSLLPSFNPVNNPLDISGQFAGDAQLIFECLQALLQDPSIDVCILVLTIMRYDALVDFLLQSQRSPQKPLLILFTGGSLSMPSISILERSQRFPVFWRPDKCVEAVLDLARYRELRSLRLTMSQEVAFDEDAADGEELSERSARRILSESESRMILSRYGIMSPKERVVHSLDGAISAAETIGYPVVLKVHGGGIAHKTDIGGVHLDLRSPLEVAEAFAKLEKTCERAGLATEVLVQEMVIGGVEVLVGMTRRLRLGPVISLAPGGTAVGLLGSPSFRVAPVFAGDVLDMLEENGLSYLLSGHRNLPAADVPALVDVILTLSRMCLEISELQEIEMNPLLVRNQGKGALALDSLIVAEHGYRTAMAGNT